ncbi:MAG: 50S ribosomal protein L13 [Candidatus Omnitrophica bacterium]|nr:50S ribosomal protein L13 [Candidatus Omnitrophota bacterium]
MKKTYIPKKEEIKRNWYLVDASNKILGRLASQVARILRGKHKVIFSPHLDTGDGVIVINAAQVKVTGKKMDDKIYYRFSGYPGGQKELSLREFMKKKPEMVFRLAVKRMLPSGPLGRRTIKKLMVYADHKFRQPASKPIPML